MRLLHPGWESVSSLTLTSDRPTEGEWWGGRKETEGNPYTTTDLRSTGLSPFTTLPVYGGLHSHPLHHQPYVSGGWGFQEDTCERECRILRRPGRSTSLTELLRTPRSKSHPFTLPVFTLPVALLSPVSCGASPAQVQKDSHPFTLPVALLSPVSCGTSPA